MAIVYYVVQIIQHLVNYLVTILQWIDFDVNNVPIDHVTKLMDHLVAIFTRLGQFAVDKLLGIVNYLLGVFYFSDKVESIPYIFDALDIRLQ